MEDKLAEDKEVESQGEESDLLSDEQEILIKKKIQELKIKSSELEIKIAEIKSGVKYEKNQILDENKKGSKNRNQDSPECYVYLMFDTSNGYYKIGISKKPEYREKTLQSEKPTIELVGSKSYPSREMARALELALHNLFKKKKDSGVSGSHLMIQMFSTSKKVLDRHSQLRISTGIEGIFQL